MSFNDKEIYVKIQWSIQWEGWLVWGQGEEKYKQKKLKFSWQ